MLEKIDLVFRVLQYAVLIFFAIFSLLEIILRKSGKTKAANAIAEAKKEVQSVAKNVGDIKSLTIKYMMEVEKRLAFEGDDKKEWVIQKVKAECDHLGLDFNLVNVSDMIEELIKFSKQVNFSQQEKIKEIIDNKENEKE